MIFFEKVINRSIPLWAFVLAVMSLSFTFSCALFLVHNEGLAKKYAPATHSVLISSINTVTTFVTQFRALINTGQINPQVKAVEFPTGFFVPINESLKGRLLVSSFDVKHGVSSIFLFDVQTQELLKSWYPDIGELADLSAKSKVETAENLPQNFRSQHPIMTQDGGVIISSGEGMMVKLGNDSKIEWHIDRHFHHSIEPALSDNQYITQIVINRPVTLKNGKELKGLRNDGYAVFSGDGRFIEEKSLAQILIDNGYEGLLLGSAWEGDRIHLNDAEYIFETDEYVRKGDVMLSARNLSIVLLYRPDENKVIWLQQGPFLNQHDIDYLGNGQFSIFGNDNVRFGNPRIYSSFSSIYLFDMKTNSTQKFLTLDSAGVSADTQGRSQLLDNGDIFVDDGMRAMILDNTGNIKLSYSHPAGKNNAGAMHWSRYLP